MEGRIVRKIAMIVENYYPSMSGVPVVMQYLSEGLVQNGYQVDVLTCGYHQGEKLKKVELHNGVSIYRYYIRQSPQYQVIGEQSEIQAFINKVRFEQYECAIITCAQCWTTNILLPFLDQIKAKKIFYTHGYSGLSFSIEWEKGLKTFAGSIYRYLWMKAYYARLPQYLGKFDAVVFISENDSAKDFNEKHGFRHGVVIDNAVEDRFFELDYVRDPNKKYILNVSNYSYVKNQEQLMEAFYQADTADYSLILIGSVETPYAQRLYKLRNEFEVQYGHKNVHILHGVPRNQINEYVRDASIFIMSSTSEQYSIALCEAMAEGVPFISTNVGNAACLPGGIIADSVSDMANAISDLLAHPIKAKALGKAGNAFAKQHNKREVAIRSLINLIEQLMTKDEA